jgi:spore germination cell wall hydrolase CwlJ-like protein
MPEKMRIKSDELMIWARTVYLEASGEPYEGMVAVAWVIRNRVEAKVDRWGMNVIGVCKAPKQFSCWNLDDPQTAARHNATLDDLALQDAYGAVIGVARGREADPTGGCTHYHAVGVSPRWARDTRSHVTIGHHRFYAGLN